MDNYDAIVVGAGPAGSMAAKTLAMKGKSVLLIERKKEIGAPVRCGEGFGSHWEEALGIKVSDKAASCHINGALLVSPDLKNSLTVRTGESKGYVLDRKVFDKELAIDAGRKGANIMVKSEVVDVVKDNGKLSGVVVENEEGRKTIHAEVIIAADGAESRVARMAGHVCAPLGRRLVHRRRGHIAAALFRFPRFGTLSKHGERSRAISSAIRTAHHRLPCRAGAGDCADAARGIGAGRIVSRPRLVLPRVRNPWHGESAVGSSGGDFHRCGDRMAGSLSARGLHAV